MKEHHNKCSHPLITPYSNEYGHPRGTLNFHVACNAPPADSEVRRIAKAYMGSPDSGHSIVFWSEPDTVCVTSDTTMKFENKQYKYVIELGRWYLHLPEMALPEMYVSMRTRPVSMEHQPLGSNSDRIPT